MADMILAATAAEDPECGRVTEVMYIQKSNLTFFFQEDVKSLPVDRALAILSLIQR